MKAIIENCNNIKHGEISIEKNSLNIKYGMNGTGKSTIAKAIANQENIYDLRTFGSDTEPKVNINERINTCIIFDNEFINSITFKGSEVIENGFEIFIKTDEYDRKREEINKILGKLNKETFKDEKVNLILNNFYEILSKIQLNTDKSIKKNPAYKSILKKENMFEVPEKLEKYSEFIKDKDNNISWVEWKTKGFNYDNKEKCPFCAEKLSETYTEEKKTFKDNYTKASMKNLTDIYDFINKIQIYLNEDKYKKIIECVTEEKNEDEINFVFQKFILEIGYLYNKFLKIQEFDSYKINNDEIKDLGEKVKQLNIEKDEIVYFNNKNMFDLINKINKKIEEILKKITELQAKTATLNTFIRNSINSSKEDINKFLATAGFDYQFEFQVESESDARTTLVYKGEQDVNVDNIQKHLSWGEKNAFALVLFMYYAISKNADLIILDDPISSFDSNKKYAIINRLFENRTDKKSFFGRTVIMLTHDFEPVIDFIINNKPNSGHAISKYIKNSKNIINEKNIEKENDIMSIVKLSFMYASKNDMNIISRINFLRKYIEHISVENKSENQLIYDMLSSIIHAKQIPDKQISRDKYIKFTEEEFNETERNIKKYIENFDYNVMRDDFYNKDYIISQFFIEKNNYIKTQLFREYLEITDERKTLDNNLIKFIDEIYHIENDYIFSLDLVKFDTIPDYIMDKIEEFMSNKKNEL